MKGGKEVQLGSDLTKVLTNSYLGKNADKILYAVIGTAVILGVPYVYKKWRRNNYIKNNINNPNLRVALMIGKKITKVSIPFLPDFILWTKENDIVSLAKNVTNFEELTTAYRIIFGTELLDDLRNLGDDQMAKFLSIASKNKENIPSSAESSKNREPIPNGIKVFATQDLNIPAVVYSTKEKKWKRTGQAFGQVKKRELIGKVNSNVIYTNDKKNFSRYYIVEKAEWYNPNLFNGYGLVWDNQLTAEGYE